MGRRGALDREEQRNLLAVHPARANLLDLLDDFVDSPLAREFDSSQQRQQIMGVFNGFERTLLDTSNVEFNAPPPEVDADLTEINWEEDVTIAAEKPSNRSRFNIFGKQASAEFKTIGYDLGIPLLNRFLRRPTLDQLQIEKLLGNHDPVQAILDYITTSKNMKQLQNFYETTLEALKDAKNNRLWFKPNTKLGKLYFDRNDFGKLQKILKQLHQSCQTDDGEDDLKKGKLLEVYALEIQIAAAGAREGEFEKVLTDFFEAFKNYDEYGSSRRTTCLKYLVLANVLKKSGINPFDSQEAKPHKNGPEILSMTNLIVSYKNNDIMEFESILRNNRNNTMADPFIREHIENLLRNRDRSMTTVRSSSSARKLTGTVFAGTDAFHKGIFYKAGRVFNVVNYALDVIVNRRVNGTILVKRIEHVKSSRCRKDILRRVKEKCSWP
ncbi:hypothetical protein pipiens_018076 [Culex pipiens pipiens]|uniref:Uncharacterized protein n=1 Tax=Culex pipiens pipiens TaxID=38569 RepID=A0ABD1CEN3_CULPP